MKKITTYLNQQKLSTNTPHRTHLADCLPSGRDDAGVAEVILPLGLGVVPLVLLGDVGDLLALLGLDLL